MLMCLYTGQPGIGVNTISFILHLFWFREYNKLIYREILNHYTDTGGIKSFRLPMSWICNVVIRDIRM